MEWNRLSSDCVGAGSVNMFKNKIHIYLRGTFRYIGWTFDKPKGFLVHLLSRVDSLGGNLVKSGKILLNCRSCLEKYVTCV